MHAALNSMRRAGVLAACAAASGSYLLFQRNSGADVALCKPKDKCTAPVAKQDVMTCSFLHEVPKTDLHVHLDGSVRADTLIGE